MRAFAVVGAVGLVIALVALATAAHSQRKQLLELQVKLDALLVAEKASVAVKKGDDVASKREISRANKETTQQQVNEAPSKKEQQLQAHHRNSTSNNMHSPLHKHIHGNVSKASAKSSLKESHKRTQQAQTSRQHLHQHNSSLKGHLQKPSMQVSTLASILPSSAPPIPPPFVTAPPPPPSAESVTSLLTPLHLPPPPLSPSRVSPAPLPPQPQRIPRTADEKSGVEMPKRALWPATLSSGPESGLCNQIFALVGWTIIARVHRTALILPNWTSHDNGGHPEAFERLFEEEPFIQSLFKYTKVVAYSIRNVPPNMALWRPSAREGGSLAGWRKYKSSGHAHADITGFEKAVFLGLVPSRMMRERVEAVKQTLGGAAYGCLHARIETDMIASWRVNRAGPPPSLKDYMSTMGTVAEITQVKNVFVAVGLAISKQDSLELNKPTPWGSRLVRSSMGKAWHRGTRNESEPSYIEAAMVDFYTCREAQWLVGWPGTTFGRTLAALQIYDHEHTGGWYQVCPAGGATDKELGPTIKRIQTYNDHQACMAFSETLAGQRAAIMARAANRSAAGRRLEPSIPGANAHPLVAGDKAFPLPRPPFGDLSLSRSELAAWRMP